MSGLFPPVGLLLVGLALVVVGAAEFWYPLMHFMQPGILFPELAAYKPMTVIGVLVLARALARRMPGEERSLLSWPSFAWLLVFVGIQVVSVYRAGMSAMVQEAIYFVPLVVFTLASILLVTSPVQLRRYLYGTIAGCMVVVVYGLMAATLGWESAVGGRAGAYGMYENHNDYTFVILMVLPFIVACWRERPIAPLRWLLFTCGLACVAGILLSLSRGGILALAIQCAIMLVMFAPRGLAIAAMPVLLAGALLVVKLQFDARAANQGSQYTAADAEYSRMELWRTAYKMIKVHPLLGVGSRTFAEVSQDYGEISGDNRGKNSHNTYLEVAAGTGALGFAAFAAMLVATWRTLRRRVGETTTGIVELARGAAMTALITILFRAVFDAKQVDFSFYFLVAMSVACGRLRAIAPADAAPASAGDRVRLDAPVRRKPPDRPGRLNGRRIPLGAAPAPRADPVTSDTGRRGRHADNRTTSPPAKPAPQAGRPRGR